MRAPALCLHICLMSKLLPKQPPALLLPAESVFSLGLHGQKLLFPATSQTVAFRASHRRDPHFQGQPNRKAPPRVKGAALCKSAGTLPGSTTTGVPLKAALQSLRDRFRDDTIRRKTFRRAKRGKAGGKRLRSEPEESLSISQRLPRVQTILRTSEYPVIFGAEFSWEMLLSRFLGFLWEKLESFINRNLL
ncbi:uncharacterized protein LOC120301498 isoform X2 [Crotalus tigris]|uniref:uncharacterized protein LOC120301498 isoform X2 n=1 Tax=Crotalus tigris TaxID=88082 RepID=UPI00192F19A9|nr:uncharacterized protein LOC120301498 isoform X2 [Crotalus tigris]